MKRILVFVCMVLFLGSFVSAEYAAAARFVNNGDGTVTDTQTGLMWANKDNGSKINWWNAESYCKGYSGGGKSGWRLPTIDELRSLHNSGAYGSVINRTGGYVWSSKYRLGASNFAAFLFDFDLGREYWDYRDYPHNSRALPVRSGQ